MENMRPAYAGFWKRFLASFIDSLIVSVAMSVVSIPVNILLGIRSTEMLNEEFRQLENNQEMMDFLSVLFLGVFVLFILGTIVNWLYFAFMESSKSQATLGKMALGLKVTDLNGKRISFGKATARSFSKLLSMAIFMIGYIMAAFTEKKQALHDMIAGTLVIER